MASKSAKRSAASSSSNVTPQVPSSSSSVQSPMTPTRMSRIQEKNTLASLNDRLAAYIDRNQQLENENSNMTKQLSSSEEHLTRTVNRITKSFDKQLSESRRLVDETAKDKAKLSFDHDQLKQDFAETKHKLDKKLKEAAALQKQVNQIESQLLTLQNINQKASADKDKLAAEKKELDSENARLVRDVENLKRQLEVETMRRIDAENKLKSKIEEFEFKNSQSEELIEEMRTHRTVEIQEVGGQLQQEYDKKLQQSVQELREEYETQLRGNKEELDNLYEQKVADLKAQLKRYQNSANSKADEIADLVQRMEVLNGQVNKLELERNTLSEKAKGLTKKIDDDQTRFFKILVERDDMIEGLSKDKADLRSEYQELMDTKVGLDNELAMYRKLLEGEERRLSLSPRVTFRLDHEGTPVGSGSGTGSRPIRGALKRKRTAIDEFDESSSFETLHTTTSGEIEISEDDPEGKFIKLHNKGDKEVSLSGWQLIRISGENETAHKFHRSVKIGENATVTVYSSDVQGIVNEPPAIIVMKGVKWFSGDQIATILKNTSDEEVARRETRRVHTSQQRRRLGLGTASEDLFQQEPDGAQPDRCVIC